VHAPKQRLFLFRYYAGRLDPVIQMNFQTGMTRHLVALAAFLVQPEPPAFAMQEVISDRIDIVADARETIIPWCRSAPDPFKPIKVSLSIESSSLRASSGRQHRGLATPHDVLGPTHGACQVDVENPSGRQVIEEPADRRQVLFNRRLGERGAKLFDGRQRCRLDLMKLQAALVGPVEELFHRAGISSPRVAVTESHESFGEWPRAAT